MGNAASEGSAAGAASPFDPAQTAALDRIVSEQSYMMSDDTWSTFFTIHQPLVDMPPDALQPFLRPYAHNISRNTTRSGNFRMLVRHLTRCVQHVARSSSSKASAGDAAAAAPSTTKVLATDLSRITNVLLVVRYLCKDAIAISSSDLMTLINTPGTVTKDAVLSSSSFERRQSTSARREDPINDDIAFDFLDAILSILVDAPTDDTYDLYVECLNLVVILVSTSSSFLAFFMTHAARKERGRSAFWATSLVKRLLVSYLDQVVAPRLDAASAVAAAALLPTPKTSWNVVDFFTDTTVYPLADRSILLLNLLVSHGSTPNPFRDALAGLADRDESSAAHGLPFSQLAAVMGRHMASEINLVLLYHCLLVNPTFRDALCRPLDVEHFILPLLEAFYDACGTSTADASDDDLRALYVYLIVLLRLTENPIVVQTLHQTQVDEPLVWYSDRYLCDLSAGSVVLLLLTRMIKVNLTIYRDPHVHTLAFGVLWNLMQFAKHLHPAATQSLLKLLAHAVKKEHAAREQAASALDDNRRHERLDETTAYLDCMALVLEAIELGSAPRHVAHNAQLMYSLLHASAVLETLKDHPDEAFQNHSAHRHVQGVVAYFKAIVDQEERAGGGDLLSVEHVLEHIQRGCKELAHSATQPPDQPAMYYCYEENDTQASSFFATYLRRLVADYTSDLSWT
ncbi:Aste57867_14104 [Aphanomyces stellatus]|uniref:Dymeclin n=1 Tax=Aphanomyces stellatus TaxID=120398 RepID=A0A485L0Q9_9STRA|nr:hypothetical protein As57867_014053 [Aphanomyces stellatus]VFT90932.1 Aste57867_14104 [Aphanomyces stellatus]